MDAAALRATIDRELAAACRAPTAALAFAAQQRARVARQELERLERPAKPASAPSRPAAPLLPSPPDPATRPPRALRAAFVPGGRHEPIGYPREPDGLRLLDELAALRQRVNEPAHSRSHLVRVSIHNLASLLRDDPTWASYARQYLTPPPTPGNRKIVLLGKAERTDLDLIAERLHTSSSWAALAAVRLLHNAYQETT